MRSVLSSATDAVVSTAPWGGMELKMNIKKKKSIEKGKYILLDSLMKIYGSIHLWKWLV